MSQGRLTRRRMLQATGVAIASGLAGCGGGGGGDSGDGAGGGTGDGGGQADADVTVTVGGDGAHFDPETVEISVGETVAWEGTSADHKIQPRDTPDGAEWSGRTSEFLNDGQTYTHTFETPGTYTYACSVYHSSGSGTVEVSE